MEAHGIFMAKLWKQKHPFCCLPFIKAVTEVTQLQGGGDINLIGLRKSVSTTLVVLRILWHGEYCGSCL